MNTIENKDPYKKRLLRVKIWMGTRKINVGLLVDIGLACNSMLIALCEKLGLVVNSSTQTLARFSWVSHKTMGVTRAENTLGEWSKVLQFHVIADKVQPTLEFLRIK